MKPLRCIVGLHKGNIHPAYELEEDTGTKSAFKCTRCGYVDPLPTLMDVKDRWEI